MPPREEVAASNSNEQGCHNMVATNGQILKERSQEIPPRPIPLVVAPENIPDELKPVPNWVCWAYERRQNRNGEWKWTKPPIQTNSDYARSNRPETWTTFDRVYQHYRRPWGTEP